MAVLAFLAFSVLFLSHIQPSDANKKEEDIEEELSDLLREDSDGGNPGLPEKTSAKRKRDILVMSMAESEDRQRYSCRRPYRSCYRNCPRGRCFCQNYGDGINRFCDFIPAVPAF